MNFWTFSRLKMALPMALFFVAFGSPAAYGNLCAFGFGKKAVETRVASAPSGRASPELLHKRLLYFEGESRDPYKLSHDIKSDLSKLIRSLSTATSENLGLVLSEWVDSPAHALFIYDTLHATGKPEYADVLTYLFKQNKWFRDAVPQTGPPGQLLTWAFEKESSSGAISLWYKDAKISDEAWFDLPEKERMDRLHILAGGAKRRAADSFDIAPTEFKPKSLGGYSEELPGTGVYKRIWEIATKRYEISLKRLMTSVREVAEMFKEKHSFHVHLVFDMAADYPMFERFRGWVKMLNDYLYLRGMEEGLHGNTLMGIAELDSARNLEGHATGVGVLPNSALEIGRSTHKFFSAGVRAEIYGRSLFQGRKKIGLEFRDTTRNLDALEQTLEQAAATVSTAGWEKLSLGHKSSREKLRLLTNDSRLAHSAVIEILGPEFTKLFVAADPTVAIPLMDFEGGLYPDYQTGVLKSVPPEVRERIHAARLAYVESLRALVREIEEMKRQNKTIDSEEIRSAIRWNLSDWAKLARVSELYKGF